MPITTGPKKGRGILVVSPDIGNNDGLPGMALGVTILGPLDLLKQQEYI